jgi:hypothetical protein
MMACYVPYGTGQTSHDSLLALKEQTDLAISFMEHLLQDPPYRNT